MEKNFMKEALKEAQKAYDKLEVPVGAIIVKDGKIIARAHNLKESKNSSISHAEILAIQKANKKIGAWRLENCEMYITLEPCMMCMGAILNSRINKIIFGTENKNFGALKYLNDKLEIIGGIYRNECANLISNFFYNKRK